MYLESSNPDEVLKAILSLKLDKNEAAFIMIGEKNHPDIPELIINLNKGNIKFFGGIFPGIIHGTNKYESGCIISSVPVSGKPHLITGLDKEDFELPDLSSPKEISGDESLTAIVLVDGLTSNISLFLSKLLNAFESTVNYFGGGAGSLSLKQSPCLFTSEGFVQDAAIVAIVPLKSKLGVQHGWEKIMGPVVATKTEKNIVIELNWENAFEVYKKTVEHDSGLKFTDSNFFDISKCYPFGIYKEGQEDIVRDPIAVNDKGELICVGEVPENTVLNILRGKNENLIKAAGKAASDCALSDAETVKHAFVVDCISRVLFLEDSFTDELTAVQNELPSNQTPVGMLTLGEISSYGTGLLEFFNKTTVIGVFYG